MDAKTCSPLCFCLCKEEVNLLRLFLYNCPLSPSLSLFLSLFNDLSVTFSFSALQRFILFLLLSCLPCVCLQLSLIARLDRAFVAPEEHCGVLYCAVLWSTDGRPARLHHISADLHHIAGQAELFCFLSTSLT